MEERTAELENANQLLRQIPSKLISVQEAERKRLASELHDSIGRTLAALKFWIEMVLKHKDAGDGVAAFNHLEQFVPILQRSIEETSTTRSFGLTSMRERTEFTGGSFSIDSAPGEGTTIRAHWPIQAEDQFRKCLDRIATV